MMYLSEARKRLEELQTIYPANVAPCREDEVLALERRVGRSLPGAYKEFLLWMGHGSTGVFRGTDCFYYDLPAIGFVSPKERILLCPIIMKGQKEACCFP